MRAILSFLLILGVTVAMGQSFGTKIDPNREFSEKLKMASERTNTILCDFDQTKFLSVLSNTSKTRGKFYFKKAQNICLEYSVPQGNVIIMNGTKFKMVANGKTTVVGMKSNPMMRQLGGMLSACMTGNLSLFGKESVTEYYESSSHYTVVVTPTSSRVKSHMKQIILQFDKKDMTLSMMKMLENDTDYTLYEFKNKKLNTEIDESKFAI